jgi:hypothetical protein
MNALVGVVMGFVAALILAGAVARWRSRRNGGASGRQTSVQSSIQQLKAVGELSVYKVFTKEIVTEIDHAWGEIGRKYLSWIFSVKKMAMIFEFEIDFRYDLRSADFQIIESEGAYTLRMPPCLHETSIRDIRFYDEQKSKLVPWLLPDLVNTLFGGGFDEQDRNRLKDAARRAAETQAQSMIGGLRADVEKSAEQTLRSLARAFGAEQVRFEFPRSKTDAVAGTPV